MKIFVSADMEGINGIVHPDQVTEGRNGYERARVWMTEEVNALAEGLFEGGAEEVFVVDSHNEARNILFDLVDERVSLMQGDTRQYSMVHGIDETFDGFVALGYHARFGTPRAIMDHTYNSGTIADVKINGVSYGELGLNSFYAAGKGVPLIMATGDQQLEKEAKAFDPCCETAVVKYAEGRFCARFVPKKAALNLIRETAKTAVSTLAGRKVIEIPELLVMEITFRTANLAEGAMRVPGTERIGDAAVRKVCTSTEEMILNRQVIFNAAGGFHGQNF